MAKTRARTAPAPRSAIVVAAPSRALPARAKTNTRAIKAEERLRSLGRRARVEAERNETAIIAVGSALGFAMLNQKVKLPTVMNIDPKIVYGLGLALAGPRLLGGKNGARVEAAGVGLLSAAASAGVERGTFKVAGDDDDDL